MIEIYTWNTPNGYKVPILLEELEVPYSIHAIDINAQEQKADAFVALNPNQKIPVLVDTEAGVTISESGAILFYIAEKHEKFLALEAKDRALQMQWLMFQMASVGPMFGQANHFLHYAPEKIPYGIERYTAEAARIMRILDGRLSESAWLGGEYSIADIATWPWIRKGMIAGFVDIAEYSNAERWYRAIESRPAVSRAIAKIDAACAAASGSKTGATPANICTPDFDVK